MGKIQRRGQMKKLKKRVKGNSLTRVTKIACLRMPSQRRFISGRWGPSWGWMLPPFLTCVLCPLDLVLFYSSILYINIISRSLDLFLFSKVWNYIYISFLYYIDVTLDKSLIPPLYWANNDNICRRHMEPNCIRKVLAFVLDFFYL